MITDAGLFENIADILENYKQKYNDCSDTVEIIIALSGGLDSVVLLDALYKVIKINSPDISNGVSYTLKAVYIDHQLQPDSKSWNKFNHELSLKYNIPFESYAVTINDKLGVGIESAAREARYACFAKLLTQDNKILLTAHHLNDQSETFLLQLIRGAGPKGLSAMPKIKKIAQGYHLRPLLDISRQELYNYAKKNNLTWVDDKTNLDIKFDRNYIRHHVLPLFEQRWSKFINKVAVSAGNCAEYEEVLAEYINEDYCKLLETIIVANISYNCLKINLLMTMSIAKQRLIIRHWLDLSGINMPSRKIINHIIIDCLKINNDTCAEVNLGDCRVQRYRNNLFLIKNQNNAESNIASSSLDYKFGEELDITHNRVKLNSKFIMDNRLLNKIYAINIPEDKKITVKFRNGGERCRPVGRNGSVTVKKLMQEHNIPPWQRNRIPLIYADNEIACVVGVSTCLPFAAQPNKPGELASGWVVESEYY